MTNKIFNISTKDFIASNPSIVFNNCFVVNIHGADVQTKEELFNKLKQEYSLPDTNGWDAISDWLTDLSWIKANNFQLNIFDYKEFLTGEPKMKEIFLEVFSEEILPFWEKEVLETVVGGETKGFVMYCID